MEDLKVSDIFDMQEQLQQRHPEWGGYYPEKARESLLWSFEEMGEVVAILKKKSLNDILEEGSTRDCFLEETCDVLMYLSDMLLSLNVSPDELSEAFRKKFCYNMNRDWVSQNKKLYTHSHLEQSE